MSIIMLEQPFFSLPNIGLDAPLDDFVLDTEYYERAMAHRNGGLVLDKIKANQLPEQDVEHYEQITPYHYTTWNKYDLRAIISEAERQPRPTAKSIESLLDLEKDILIAYQVAYAHYAITMNHDMHTDQQICTFPDLCCGISGKSLFISLLSHGLLNACYVYNDNADHAYAMLPFVLQKPSVEGAIIVDPTSDQLGFHKGRVYRNLVTIKTGCKWEYITEYANGKNLFPEIVFYLGLLHRRGSVTSEEVIPRKKDMFHQDCEDYLKKAFANPARMITLTHKN